MDDLEILFQKLPESEDLSIAFQNWYSNKHNISKWLTLSKILASLIDKNIPYSLEFRNKCVDYQKIRSIL